MKRPLRYFGAISITAVFLHLFPLFSQANDTPTVRKIILDPGHGGKDAGCVYGKIYEKDIVLAIALKLGKMLEDNLPDAEVIYTRKTDVWVDLQDRGKIANNAKADLFVSIHVDAQEKGTSANGNSTWIVGTHRTEDALRTVMRENSVILYEEDYETTYQGYDPNDPESYIMFSLMQYSYREQSLMLASLVQKHYKTHTKLNDRGARDAGFLVLHTPAMPSILTETGFITNPDDRKFLTSADGQEKVARSLFNAISEYKSIMEGRSTVIRLDGSEARTSDFASAEDASSTDGTTGTAPSAGAPRFVTSGRETADSPVFRIQISAATSKINTNDKSKFGTYAGKITEKKIGNYYKYFVEEAVSYQEALSLQRKVRQKFKDAFIVAFTDDQQVAITEEMKSR